MDLELAGKRAVVTGASKGIGRAIARQLLLEGATVVGGARNLDALEATAAELAAATGGTMTAVAVDTGDDDAVRRFVAAAREAMGGIDILVNNAAAVATGGGGGLAEATSEQFFAEMNVKVMGYLRCAQAAAPVMVEQGWGRIVNISGLAARQAGTTAVYSIRNVGVAALTKVLADELGPQGVNVTVVHPGATRTERTAEVTATLAGRLGVDETEAEKRMAAGNTLGRLIDAEEVAYVVAFLASPKSVAINGDVIAVGGGAKGAIHY